MKYAKNFFASIFFVLINSIPNVGSAAAEYPPEIQGTFQFGEGTCAIIKKNPSLATQPAIITQTKSKSEYETCTIISARKTKPNEFAIVENCVGEDGGGKSARTYKIVNPKKIVVVTKAGDIVLESCS